MVRTAQPPCRCRRNAMLSYRESRPDTASFRSRGTTQTGAKASWAGRGPLPLQQAAHESAASSAVNAKVRHPHQPAPAPEKQIAQALLQSPPHSHSPTRGPRPRRLSETIEERLACLLDAAEYIRRLAHELQQSQARARERLRALCTSQMMARRRSIVIPWKTHGQTLMARSSAPAYTLRPQPCLLTPRVGK